MPLGMDATIRSVLKARIRKRWIGRGGIGRVRGCWNRAPADLFYPRIFRAFDVFYPCAIVLLGRMLLAFLEEADSAQLDAADFGRLLVVIR